MFYLTILAAQETLKFKRLSQRVHCIVNCQYLSSAMLRMFEIILDLYEQRQTQYSDVRSQPSMFETFKRR